ncbi:MAG: tetratricopeptide repeat protein [Sulfuricaulis sp.]
MTTRWLTGFFLLMLALLSGCTGSFLAPEQPVSDNSAVVSLVGAAHASIVDGKFDAAVASLERALRIEPRNPALWQELAKLRLQQGQYQQAEGLAARSNGWAESNKTLRAENWRIIGQARLKHGDYPGAQTAFDKAAELAN